MRGPVIDFNRVDYGGGVPCETWEGLTTDNTAAKAVIDLYGRVPDDIKTRLPSFRQLARLSNPFRVCDSLLEALDLADPEAAADIREANRAWCEKNDLAG